MISVIRLTEFHRTINEWGKLVDVHVNTIIIRLIFSSFSFAESPPRDLQGTAYK